MTPPIRVLIADDFPRSRTGLRALLATWPEVDVIGEAANGQEAIRLVAEIQPDVVLMDARMPVINGLEATRLIKNRWPDVRIVVLTMYTTCQPDALAAGADAFLTKGCADNALLGAILGGD